MENLSDGAKQVYQSLLDKDEGTASAGWGTVYLDNAIPTGMNAYQFAGYLSALERVGLYRPDEDGFFGYVKQT